MKIGIVILHWNNYTDTFNCLNSVSRLEKLQNTIEVVIVDNASTNDSLKKLESNFRSIHFLKNSENLGFAAGNNRGIQYFIKRAVDFILILNNDTIVSKTLILELLKTQQKTGAAIISPKIYFTKGYEFHKNRYSDSERGNVLWYGGGAINWKTVIGYHIGVDEVDKGQFNQEKEIECATGAALFITKEAVRLLGGFNSRYYLYYEDIDLCMRAKQQGLTVFFSPKSILWHNNAGSSSSGSGLQDYYITRNRLLFGSLHAPLRVNMHLIWESVRLILNGRKWQKKGVIDFMIRKFAKGSYE